MPVLLLVVCFFILVHVILVKGVLEVLRVHVLYILEVWILMDGDHDLADDVVILVLWRQDDLELWVLTNVQDELCWNV